MKTEKLALTPYPIQNKILKLNARLEVVRLHRKVLLSILRKMIVQQKRAAKRLHDPQATATLIEIEAEFKDIQKLIRQNKAA